jgi:hypothetical protein
LWEKKPKKDIRTIGQKIINVLFYYNRDGKKPIKVIIDGEDETKEFKEQVKNKYEGTGLSHFIDYLGDTPSKEITEETKYKLKIAAPKTEPEMPFGGSEEPSMEEPSEPPLDEPQMDADSMPEPESDGIPFEKEPFDAGVEADEETDPKKFIEQLSGKLGQSLRKYTEDKGEPDFALEKFAVNSLLSATHTGEMDASDQKDIIKKVKSSGKKESSEKDEEQDIEPEEEIDVNVDAEETSEPKDDEEELDESMFIEKPKKLSIFAPEGSEEAKYNLKQENTMHEESNNYMFWQNLKTMHESISHLLEMNCDEVDALLSDGHGWALDHIATSADDVEEVYHFISNNLSKDEEHDYEEWSKPMELKSDVQISDGLKYHIENEIPLGESAFRFGSDKFMNLVKEIKSLHKRNLIKLNENDEFIVNEFDNEYIMIGNDKVKLNFIYEEVESEDLTEAEYRGKKVQLGKPKRGGSKKFYVYVKDPKSGNIKKVSFGAKSGGGKLAVKLKDPKARKAFSDRHKCPQKKDKTSAGYWACRLPRYARSLNLSGGGRWW